ncbi:glyoxalase [Methylovirgula ligni]|uniref:VOC domain-containing protein n=1 Tax=Methylovirgula ligni TaxID=569860 RepID=A0A3D9Z4E3_9HYPH|nr:VOC family protein [Methylovirgula ligni]QAY95066.1 glyoxalase [Methylovirgula ligni]REF89655.1 hypothetical protein DES32_0890 [Methylovirgula ligni]
MASKFVWYELMTSDAPGAESFYRDVVGWSARDAGMTNLKYTLLLVGEIPVAGLMQCPPDVPQGQGGPGWLGYVGVADVDATLAQAQKLGASVHRAPTDIPGVGRFAVLADPQGAVFALFKPNGASTPPAPMTPGTIGWHELHAADAEKAFAFYSALFGWQRTQAIDMGPLGIYQVFGDESAPMGFGGMFNKPAEEAQPYWLYYFAVADIDAAAARVTASGGIVRREPQQVPGGAWIIQGQDPQGATFALVGMRRNGSA